MFATFQKRFLMGLEWWGRRATWWWLLLAVVTLTWCAYDVGQMVARSSLVSMGSPAQGTLSVQQVVDRASDGGRLIITGPTTARFIDPMGKTWEVPGFGDRVSREDLRALRANHVNIDGDISVDVAPVKTTPRELIFATLADLGIKLSMLALYGGLIYFILRQIRGGGQRRFRKMDAASANRVRIEDVAGYEGPKQEVMEVVEYLKNPERYDRVGARPARGVLLYGPPGTGKTYMAKAIAGSAQANFLVQSGSSFVRLFAGAGAASVSALFAEARRMRPSVIFIDEIDAVGGHRGQVGSHGEREQTLNQLLVELDGFENNEGLVVIAATNRLDALDPALLRAGRFDRKVFIGPPGRADREAILRQHIKTLPAQVRCEVDFSFWAGQTPGFVGVDLAGLINEAATEAARANRDRIIDADFSAARDRVMMGARDHGRQLTSKERATVATHELGHALVRLANGGRVEKVSILPRGQALGVTITTLEEEALLQTHRHLQAELQVLMGGRAAEEVMLGEVTTGAYDDIERASRLAREAVRRFGGDLSQGPYLPEATSGSSADELEKLARQWVHEAYQTARQVIERHRQVLETLTPHLIQMEEIEGSWVSRALNSPEEPGEAGWVGERSGLAQEP